MNSRIQICTIFFVILLAGCSGSPYENPIGPGLDDVTPQQTTDNTDPLPGNRIVWGIWTVRVSEDHSSIVAARDRSAEMHLNLVRFLEVFPCDDCLSIGNIQVIQPNEISLDLTIRHPFEDNLNLTGFDVRAIFISGADYSFPTMERSIAWGDDLPRLLNPDGYTALFNPTEFPDTDPDPWIFKYTPGMYSTGGDLTATLNPFVAYGTENPRRMFYPGNVETKEIHLHVPSGGFEFGYAIEGSWVDPGKDVILPEIDFPVSASSIEPYMVSVWLGDGLKPVVGSEASIFVEVHDFQGLHTIGDVIVEAPDLLDGTLSLEFDVPTGDESWQYKGTLINESGAGPGTYPILVKVESVQDDPNLGELAAYQLCEVEIPEVLITSITEVTPPWLTSISLKVWIEEDTAIYWASSRIFHFFDISDPLNPVWLGKLDAGGTTVNCVEVTDGYLYTTYYIDGNYTSIQVYDIDPPENAHLVGMADAYPWQSITLDYQDGYLYTFAGTVTDPKQFGFCVFDVTSPENPQYIETRIVDNVDMCRELRIKDGIAYALTGDVLGVLCIYDLFSQDTAQLIGYVELVYSYFFDDMVLNDYYAFLHSSDSSSLYIVDIEPPEEAHLVKTIDEEFCGLFEIRDDLLFSSDDWNLNIYDIDPVSDTHLVQTMPLPVGSVNVTLDGQYAYLPVNHSNCMYIADIDPIESAHIINTVFGVARNAHMILVDDINYLLGSNMLQILDISTPSQSELITSLILHNGIRDMDYENGYVYIASLDEGLLVVDVEPLEATHLVTTLPLGSNTRIVGVNNSTACVISSQDLWIVDVGIPDSPDLIDVFDLAENGIQLEVQGNYAFVLESGGYMDYTMSVIDISDPYNAALKNTVTIPAKDICAFLIEGSRIYIGDDASPNFIHVVDISNPESAFLAASLQSSDTPEFFDVHGDLLFKAGDSPGLVVLDVGLLDDIQLVFSDPSVESDRIVVDDNRMFLSGYTLRIYEWY